RPPVRGHTGANRTEPRRISSVHTGIMHRRFLAILAFCFLASPSFAAITGIVMNADGQPVAGAKVSIRASETVEASRARLLSASPEAVPIATVQTDSKGAFSLESPKEPT